VVKNEPDHSLFRQILFLLLEHPHEQIINTYPGRDQQQRGNKYSKADEQFEPAVAFIGRRRKLILRKIWRWSIHYSLKLAIRRMHIKSPGNN